MASQKSVRSELSGNLGFLSEWIKQFRLVWLLLRDNRVSTWVKLIIPLSLAYLISPVDVIPDVIPGLTQLDDLGVILLGMALFVRLCPSDIVNAYRHQLEYGTPADDGETVEATYRVMDEE